MMMKRTTLLLATTHRIVMPPFRSSTSAGRTTGAGRNRQRGSRLQQQESDDGEATASSPSPTTERAQTSSRVFFESNSLALDVTNRNFIKRRELLNQYKERVDDRAEDVWRGKKFHLTKQERLVDELGGNVEAAVREHLQPTKPSFRSDLRQRPLDRKILEEIYRDLHGKRTERKLRKGVQWEHWLAKGDGTAPVYTATQSAQQTFGFGGTVELYKRASHRDLFPSNDQGCPEVAFIGRTNSGKSSLINAILNSPTCAYGHLPGSTSSVNFYRIGSGQKLTIVDCPGYGHYHAAVTSAVATDNAQRVLNDYLLCCSQTHTERLQQQSQKRKQQQGASSSSSSPDWEKGDTTAPTMKRRQQQQRPRNNNNNSDDNNYTASRDTRPKQRNIKRVFVCVSSQGIQQQDLHYIDFLNRHKIPFSVVIMKSDTQQVRFLARMTDYIRCQLIHYTHCHELLLVSALRLAGISKVQTLLANFAAGRGGTSKHAVDEEHPIVTDDDGHLDLSNIV